MKRVSLVIPIYNEEQLIKKTLIKLHDFIKKDDLKWEILLVNDGSTDNTLEILKNFNKKFFKIISYKKNQGKGFAIKKGMIYASGDYICFIDSDLAYSFENLKQTLFHLNDNHIAIGSREISEKKREKTKLSRKILGQGLIPNAD